MLSLVYVGEYFFIITSILTYGRRLTIAISTAALINDASKPITREPTAFMRESVGFPYVGTTPAIPVVNAVFALRPQSTWNGSLALLLNSCEICWVKISMPNPAAPAAANVTPAIVAAPAVGNNIGTSTVAVAATAPSAAPSKAPSSRSPPVHAAVNVPANAPTTADTPMNKSASISSSPVGSILITGLLLQYANVLCPRTPCPVEIYVSALMNLPHSGL